MNARTSFRWVIALSPEARVIRETYEMTSFAPEGPYPVFKDASGFHWLTLSGVGRVHAAAATMYLHQISKAPPWSAWINVGIAGNRDNPYGTLHLIDKITERSTGHRSYPAPAVTSNLVRSSLVTTDQPESSYNVDELFDMEGSSFFNIACRLSCQQLVLLLKIISDGPSNHVKNLTNRKITNLVSHNIHEISKIVSEMEFAILREHDRLRLPDVYNLIITKWHFSQTQKHRLKQLVKRWQIFSPKAEIMSYLNDSMDAKSIINDLSVKLNNQLLDWEEL